MTNFYSLAEHALDLFHSEDLTGDQRVMLDQAEDTLGGIREVAERVAEDLDNYDDLDIMTKAEFERLVWRKVQRIVGDDQEFERNLRILDGV